jgi:hypothetical protein
MALEDHLDDFLLSATTASDRELIGLEHDGVSQLRLEDAMLAAAHDLGISARHERGRWKNNRAENSHQPS